jgi:hypothetical protein
MTLTQISTAGVKDDAVTAGKIPADAIGSSEIAANAVGSSELADNAVDTAAIADDAVTSAKIVSGGVQAGNINSNAVSTGALQSNAVTTNKIADSAVTDAKIASGISASKITGLVTDSITEGDSKVEVIDSGSNGNIQFTTDNTTRAQFKTGSNYDNQLLIGTAGSSNEDIDVGVCIGSSAFSRPGVIIRGNSTNKGDISFCDNSNTDSSDGVSEGLLRYDHATDHMEFHTADSEQMRIVSNGEVGIGITNPEAYGANGNGSAGLTVQAPSGSYSAITIRSGYNGAGSLNFADGSGSAAERRNAFIDCDHVNKRINIGIEGSSKIRITENGFHPNPADTAAANALDDYEEGTFTPTATFETSDSGNKTYHTQSGSYTKIGRVVHCNINLILSNRGTGSGRLRFNGLPFTVGDTVSGTILEASATVGYFAEVTSSVSGIHPVAIQGTNQIVFYGILGQYGATTGDFGYSHVGNSFSIRFSITYQV